MPGSDSSIHFQTATLTRDLTGRSVRGGLVTVGGQVLKVVAQTGAMALLARLLHPESFGLIAMAAVIVTVLEMFKDLGLSAATVQREEITHPEVSTLFWVNVGLGVVAALLMVLLAPLLAWFYHQPRLIGITLWLGLGFVLSGLSTQHLALLRRQMRFSALAGIQMTAEIAGLTAAIVAALMGADYWALVLQRIVWAGWLAAGGWIFCGWRPGPPMKLSAVRELLLYGGHITGSNLVSTLVRSLDQILIGWWWGAVPLGLYERAYKILLVPINNLNAPLFTVAMPMLSRLAKQPEAYRRAYLSMIEKLNMVVMPCAALLIAIPDQIVRALFGAQWLAAAPIVAWLGVAALYQPIAYTAGWLFMTQDRTREMFWWGMIGSALSAVTIVAGMPFGATGVAASFAVGGLVIRLPVLFWMVGRRGPVSAWDMVKSLGPSSLAAGLIVVVLVALRRWDGFDALTLPRSLGLSGLSMALVSGLCFVCVPQSRHALREMIKVKDALGRRRVDA
ncbi:MAG TPA: lipopolysaccharide biosynthesis protein [Magnetospirillaceae bacterium]|jgi:PST family polysaccharide transporter